MKALVILLLVAAPRDADYDKVLDAWKAKEWKTFDALSARFLEEKPGYKYAHSIRYMRASSFSRRALWKRCLSSR